LCYGSFFVLFIYFFLFFNFCLFFLTIYTFNIVSVIVWLLLVTAVGLKSRTSIVYSYFWCYFLLSLEKKFGKRLQFVCICVLLLSLCSWTFFIILSGWILISIRKPCIVMIFSRAFVTDSYELTPFFFYTIRCFKCLTHYLRYYSTIINSLP
jgi:hypothetical protein